MILAFFPCIRFEDQILLWFRGDGKTQKNWSNIEKLEKDIKLMSELKQNYELVSKLFIICYRRNLQLIFENPYSEQHFLRKYWCIKPTLIDRDRTLRGDYFVKPTQYWFVNREPKNNMIFELTNNNYLGTITGVKPSETEFDVSKETIRSMIHPEYANRFIREFVLEQE